MCTHSTASTHNKTINYASTNSNSPPTKTACGVCKSNLSPKTS